MTISSAWPVFILAAVLRCQESGPITNKSELEKDRQKADALYVAGKYQEALPLYTSLAKHQPMEKMFAERRAAGLIAKSATAGKTSQKLGLQRQAYTELLRARGLGDNSPYVVTLLAKLNELFEAGASTEFSSENAGLTAPKQVATELLTKGQAAMAHGDYPLAARNFTAAFLENPGSYEIAMSAGEAEARLNNIEPAAGWFGKAIAIDPNRETAYLAWGNILLGANKIAPARDRFIDAVITWPYSKECWDGLRRWADLAHNRLSSPHLERPAFSEHFDPKAFSEDGTGRSAWVQYMVGRITYQNSLFRVKFPSETQYRHTLLEEVSSLQRAAEAIKTLSIQPGKLDLSLSTLENLNARRMLESWVLLHGADAGIVKDYPDYRNGHRELLRDYILQFDIHPIQEPPGVSSLK